MITVRLSGGMGNQLFQYALGRALSHKYHVPLALDTTFLSNQTAIPFIRPHFVPRPYQLDMFTIQAHIAHPKEIPWYARPFFKGIVMQSIDALLRKIPILPGWEKRFGYDERVWSLGPNAYLAGFWQSEKYFIDIRDILLEEIQLRTPLPPHIEQLRVDIHAQESVCVHIRRSDMVGNAFHGGVDIQYYQDAMAYIRSHASISRVYVFSDDIEWCKDHVSFDVPIIYVDKEYQGEKDSGNFMLMRACTHFVIPNSTFSWWAAWLAEKPQKIVVAPKQWFAKDSMNACSIIPEGWVRI